MRISRHHLIVFVGTAWLLILGLGAMSPEAEAWRYQQSVRSADGVHNFSKDPKVGSHLPPELRETFSVRAKVRFAAVLGACNACSAKSFQIDRLPKTTSNEFAVVYATKRSEITVKANAPNVHVVADPTGELSHRTYSAVFTPRLFAYAPDGTLMAAQQPEESYESFIEKHQE